MAIDKMAKNQAKSARHLLYLHGLHSSPESSKAQSLVSYLKVQGLNVQLHLPQLDYDPSENQAKLFSFMTKQLEQDANAQWGIIGSSMGGFYAEHLSRVFNLPSVLINPVVDIDQLLPKVLGEQKHPLTGQIYRFSADDKQKLALWKQAAPALTGKERILVCLGLQDKTVCPQPALSRYKDYRSIIEREGGHAFEAFARYIPQMLHFLWGSE